MRNSVIPILLLFLAACRNNAPEGMQFSEATLIDSASASAPYLTNDHRGRPVLSWIRRNTDSTNVFCYAVSTDDGHSFNKPIIIAPSTTVHPHAENLPKIVFKPTGEIIAMWGVADPNPKNAYSGLIYYSQSFDSGANWTSARRLVASDTAVDQRYFDLAVMEGGEVAVTWLDSRKTVNKAGSALYFARTTGRNGFGEGRPIAQPTCECCRTAMAARGDWIHVLYRGIINDSIRDMLYVYSNDAGMHFSEPVRISKDDWVINGCPHSGPAIFAAETHVECAWYTGAWPRGIYATRSSQTSVTEFSKRDSVSSEGRHPQLRILPGGGRLIAFDESYEQKGKYYSNIVISRDGKQRIQVTRDTAHAAYPVMTAALGHLYVAYSSVERGVSRVRYVLADAE